jgi:hypothetical protein
VEAQWSDAMRRLGMFAFYPATEDAQPGDVYLLVPPPYGVRPFLRRRFEGIVGATPVYDSTRFSLVRISTLSPLLRAVSNSETSQRRLSALEHLQQQQHERFRMQPLPNVEAAKNQTPRSRPFVSSQQRGSHWDVGYADQDSGKVRLQRSAIPALRVAKVTESQLSASGFLGNVGAAFGLNRGSETALTISLSNIQELQLDAWRAQELYKEHGPAMYGERATPERLLELLRTLRHGRTNSYDLMEQACNGDRDRLQDQGVQVAVVTRVIYAGAIDYGFSAQTATALRGAASMPHHAIANTEDFPAETSPSAPTASAPTTGTAAPRSPESSDSPAAQARVLQEDALSRVQALVPAHRGPGVTMSLGIGTFGSLSLRETFNRPIAVGAGSRFVVAFHDALAGADESDAVMTARFRQADQICEKSLTLRQQSYDRNKLWHAMGGMKPAP